MNRKYIFIFIATLFVFAFLFVTNNESKNTYIPKETHSSEDETASVTRIIDGDTLVVLIDGKEQRIRLLGVDAAEIDYNDDKRTTKRECYSIEARDELERLTFGNVVYIKSDSLNEDKDEYGRLLRYIFLADGSLVNDILIKNGFTRHLSYFPITLNDQFAKSELEAKENNMGIWATCFK